METVVTAVPFDVAANLVVPPEFEVGVTISAVVVALPKESCSATVTGPRVMVATAVALRAVEVKTSLLTAAAVIVSFWVALAVRPEAVIVGVPVRVSP